MRTLIFTATLASVLVSCSQTPARINSTRAGMDNFKVEAVAFRAADSVPAKFGEVSESVVLVGDPVIKFKTSIAFKSDALGQKDGVVKPFVRVKVRNAAGVILTESQKVGEEIDWEVRLSSGDGAYDVLVDVVNGKDIGTTGSSSKVFHFVLDTLAPVVKTRAALTIDASGVERLLKLDMQVADLSDVVCTAVVMPGVVQDVAPIELEVKPGGLKDNEKQFSSSSVLLPDSFPNIVIVKSSCTDGFSRLSESFEAAAFDQPQFNIQAKVSANLGIPIEDRLATGPRERHFLRTGTGPGGLSTSLSLDLKLIDKVSLAEATAVVLGRERAKLQVYLTDFAVSSVADFDVSKDSTKHIYMRKLFDSHIDAVVSSTLKGKQKYYVSMTHIREKEGAEVLLGSIPLEVYVQENGTAFKYEWISPEQFVNPVLNASIPLSVKIVSASGTGAPLLGEPKIQYTTDNVAWKDAEFSDWSAVSGAADVYSFKVKYPFTLEKSFRVRVVGTDLSGNVSASGYSRNLVGAVAASANAPLCEGTNSSGLSLVKASSFLCRKDVNGEIKFSISMFARATGALPLNIAANALGCPFASRICFPILVNSNGVSTLEQVDGAQFVDPSLSRGKKMLLKFGSFRQGDIGAISNFSVDYAGSNPLLPVGPACSEASASVPLKGGSLVLEESPFNCE